MMKDRHLASRPARRPWRRASVRLGIGLLGTGLLAAAAGPLTAASASSTHSQKHSGPAQLRVNSRGVPNLHGMSLPLGKGAGAPHVGDTNAYIPQQLLQSWGAQSSLTLGEGPAVVAGVYGGHLVATGGPFDAEINGGLTVFGPSQPGQDYEFITSKSITSFSGLAGKVVAVSAPNVGDAILTNLLLRKEHLTGKVTIEYSGTEDNSLSAFIAGRVAAFWASGDSVVALRQQHVGYNPMMSARTLAPAEADSYEAATRSWLRTHFAAAEAIDLAWLYAAKIFNTDELLWLKYANGYTKGSVPQGTMAQDYTAYRRENPWPANASAFNPKNVKANFLQDAKSGGITRLHAGASEAAYADFGPWNAAVALFRAHPKAYK